MVVSVMCKFRSWLLVAAEILQTSHVRSQRRGLLSLSIPSVVSGVTITALVAAGITTLCWMEDIGLLGLLKALME